MESSMFSSASLKSTQYPTQKNRIQQNTQNRKFTHTLQNLQNVNSFNIGVIKIAFFIFSMPK